jgi:hypothetical protein
VAFYTERVPAPALAAGMIINPLKAKRVCFI